MSPVVTAPRTSPDASTGHLNAVVAKQRRMLNLPHARRFVWLIDGCARHWCALGLFRRADLTVEVLDELHWRIMSAIQIRAISYLGEKVGLASASGSQAVSSGGNLFSALRLRSAFATKAKRCAESSPNCARSRLNSITSIRH